MSEPSQKKSYLGGAYLTTLAFTNAGFNLLSKKFIPADYQDLMSIFTPVIAVVVAYILVVYGISKCTSVEEADENREKAKKKANHEQYQEELSEQLKHIKIALEDPYLEDAYKEPLKKRYAELTLKKIG